MSRTSVSECLSVDATELIRAVLRGVRGWAWPASNAWPSNYLAGEVFFQPKALPPGAPPGCLCVIRLTTRAKTWLGEEPRTWNQDLLVVSQTISGRVKPN